MKYKVAFLTSHQVQYQTPLFKEIAQRSDIDLEVYFCWNYGAKKTDSDPEFGRKIRWDISLTNGYKHHFLKNISLKPSSSFLGQINPSIIRTISKNNYDAIITHGWNGLTYWFVFLTCALKRIPFFIHGENPLNQELGKNLLKKGIKKIIFRWLFRKASACLYIGEENKKFYKHYGVPEKKLFFTPYAVDNGRFISSYQKLKDRKKDLKKKLELDPESTTILSIGKLIKKKRPLDLLGAFRQLSNEKTNLVLVGDGPLRFEIVHFIKEHKLENVHLAGFKNQTELPEYYAAADIFVLPSEAGETWGLVVNEAMCFALPIIASDIVGCAPDLVRDENSFIFPVGNVEKLSQHLKTLINNPQKRSSFGKKSLEIIQEYSYEKDAEGILSALAKWGQSPL